MDTYTRLEQHMLANPQGSERRMWMEAFRWLCQDMDERFAALEGDHDAVQR